MHTQFCKKKINKIWTRHCDSYFVTILLIYKTKECSRCYMNTERKYMGEGDSQSTECSNPTESPSRMYLRAAKMLATDSISSVPVVWQFRSLCIVNCAPIHVWFYFGGIIGWIINAVNELDRHIRRWRWFYWALANFVEMPVNGTRILVLLLCDL